MLDYTLFKEKLENQYYNLVLQSNLDYFNKHGVGPYEYKGKFANRVRPWLCAGYWLKYHKWLEAEYNVALNNNTLAFLTENDKILFILKWG